MENKGRQQLNSFIASTLVDSYIIALRQAKIKFDDAEITYEVKGNNLSIIVPNNISFQEAGRKVKVKRVPIKALIAWGIKYKISNINRYVYAIQTSIYKKGIRPKPVNFNIEQVLVKINLEPYITELSKILIK